MSLCSRATLILLVLTVTACVPAQRSDTSASWVERSDAIGNLPAWQLNGRIGLRLPDRGFSGALIWQQIGETLRVDFRGPLGAGAFRVSGNPEELVLETGDGKTYLLDDPENALATEIGWGVPLPAMRYWVIGIPHPGTAAVQTFDPQGRPVTLRQLDWDVTYERYTVFDGWEMPQKILLDNNNDVRIKLVISRWSYPDT